MLSTLTASSSRYLKQTLEDSIIAEAVSSYIGGEVVIVGHPHITVVLV